MPDDAIAPTRFDASELRAVIGEPIPEIAEKEMPALDEPPWPGELGQRIYENVSVEAWKLWEEQMKMILNEYRLMPWQKEAQELVAKQMEDFFFGDGSALPPDFVPEQSKA